MQVAVGSVGVGAKVAGAKVGAEVGAVGGVAVVSVVMHYMGHGGAARASDHPAVAAPSLPRGEIYLKLLKHQEDPGGFRRCQAL